LKNGRAIGPPGKCFTFPWGFKQGRQKSALFLFRGNVRALKKGERLSLRAKWSHRRCGKFLLGQIGALKGGKESASLSGGFNWNPQKNMKHFSGA